MIPSPPTVVARSSSSGWSARYFCRIAASTSRLRLMTLAEDGFEGQVALHGNIAVAYFHFFSTLLPYAGVAESWRDVASRSTWMICTRR